MNKINQGIKNFFSGFSKRQKAKEWEAEAIRQRNLRIKSLSKRYEDIDTYLEFRDTILTKRHRTNNQSVNCAAQLPFSSSVSEARRRLSKPEFTFNTRGLIPTTILFFPTSHWGINAELELHYSQNQLFFIQYNFPEADPRAREHILKNLLNELKLENIDHENEMLKNDSGCMLDIHSGEIFQLRFASVTHPFFNELGNIAVFYNRQQQPD